MLWRATDRSTCACSAASTGERGRRGEEPAAAPRIMKPRLLSIGGASRTTSRPLIIPQATYVFSDRLSRSITSISLTCVLDNTVLGRPTTVTNNRFGKKFLRMVGQQRGVAGLGQRGGQMQVAVIDVVAYLQHAVGVDPHGPIEQPDGQGLLQGHRVGVALADLVLQLVARPILVAQHVKRQLVRMFEAHAAVRQGAVAAGERLAVGRVVQIDV